MAEDIQGLILHASLTCATRTHDAGCSAGREAERLAPFYPESPSDLLYQAAERGELASVGDLDLLHGDELSDEGLPLRQRDHQLRFESDTQLLHTALKPRISDAQWKHAVNGLLARSRRRGR
jgi:hypothetical protein